MIPQSILDQIQDRTNIVDVIGQYVDLKRAGRNFKGNCPFHNEKTPSFVVSPDKQIYHCFGCAVGGNVFSFLTKYENIGFREAVKILADRSGVVIPESEEANRQELKLKPLYEANEFAAQFFGKNLKNANSNSDALSYIKSRSFTSDDLSKFRIGLSSSKWDDLIKSAENQFPPRILEAAGLVIKKDPERSYDRFRNRLMFPIRDIKSRVVGFGARVLDDSLPKYINSPETAIYRKSHIVYGLSEAKDFIRKEDRVLIVEGYTDVIACHRAGFRYAVSTSGTALTIDQIKLIKRFTKNIFVLFDADPAGQSAALRGLDLLVMERCDVRIAQTPKGHDPDSFIKEFGVEAFRDAVIEKAELFFDYKFGLLSKNFDASQAIGKSKIASHMLDTIRKVPSAVLRQAYLQDLAKKLVLSIESLEIELAGEKKSFATTKKNYKNSEKKVNTDNGQFVVEQLILGLMISDAKVWQEGKDLLSRDSFSAELAKELFMALSKADKWTDVAPSKIFNRFPDKDQASAMIQQAIQQADAVEDVSKAWKDCMVRMQVNRDQVARKNLQQKIVECERSNDHEQLNELLKEFANKMRKGKQNA